MMNEAEKEEVKKICKEVIAEVVPSMIEKGKEETLLLLPEIIGNLYLDRAARVKGAKELYKDNPEWKNYQAIVKNTLEETDSKNAGLTYMEIVERAKPEIKRKVDLIKGLDMTRREKPTDLRFKGDIGEI